MESGGKNNASQLNETYINATSDKVEIYDQLQLLSIIPTYTAALLASVVCPFSYATQDIYIYTYRYTYTHHTYFFRARACVCVCVIYKYHSFDI